MTFWIVPDLDLADLSLRLAYLDAGPIAFASLSGIVGSIPQSKLVLNTIRYLTYTSELVFVIELANSWEVSVLLAF